MRLFMSMRFIRFLFFGLVNTGLTFLVYFLVSNFMHYQVAYFISYILGIFFSYWLNCFFVFKQKMNFKSFVQFPVVYLIQYILGVIFMFVGIEFSLVQSKFAPLIVTVVLLPITFIVSKFVLVDKNYDK